MNFISYLIGLLKDPRAAIAGWISMGLAPTYAFIFLIVFIETGVVFMPFLPGDSLLFAAGVFAHDPSSGLTLAILLPIVWAAPILGDECNYFIGHFFGKRIIASGKVKALTPERLNKTEKMIDKWGPLAVFLGRFFPFIRTFMPFISGISGMQWRRFAPFSVLGGLVWSSLFTFLGYFFGGIPAVQDHFELVIVLILLVSLAPTIIGLLRMKFGKGNVAKKGRKKRNGLADNDVVGVAAGKTFASEHEVPLTTKSLNFTDSLLVQGAMDRDGGDADPNAHSVDDSTPRRRNDGMGMNHDAYDA
jgi:membrane-associated protein